MKIEGVSGFAEGSGMTYESALKFLLDSGAEEKDLTRMDAASGRAAGRMHKKDKIQTPNKFKRNHTGFSNSFQNGRDKVIQAIQNKVKR